MKKLIIIAAAMLAIAAGAYSMRGPAWPFDDVPAYPRMSEYRSDHGGTWTEVEFSTDDDPESVSEFYLSKLSQWDLKIRKDELLAFTSPPDVLTIDIVHSGGGTDVLLFLLRDDR